MSQHLLTRRMAELLDNVRRARRPPLHTLSVEEARAAYVAAFAYADRLRAAGIALELELDRGVTHDFIKLGRVLPEAMAAQAVIGAALHAAYEKTTVGRRP